MTIAFFTGAKAEDVNPPSSVHSAGELHVVEGSYETASTLAVDHIIKLAKIPADVICVDAKLEVEDLDSGTLLAGSLGLMEPGGTDMLSNSELILTNTVGQAAGVVRADHIPAARQAVLEAAVDNQRFVVYKVTTAAETPVAGRIKATVYYRAKEYGEE